MEAKLSQLSMSKWVGNSERTVVRIPKAEMRVAGGWRERRGHHQVLIYSHPQPRKVEALIKPLALSALPKNSPASVVESESVPVSIEEDLLLKAKSDDIEPLLDNRCIYLVGMMGSGKTTVGRVLSDVLGYSFFDCDALIEEALGGTSVSEIFKLYGENVFRDNETEVLRKLSSRHQLVVSTGGGAVVRQVNWKYMNSGISVWLDVPIEALARRITAVGTASRPLLHQESGDAYTKTFMRLSTLLIERGEAYASANARVSLEKIAAKMGYADVCSISPAEIALEALVQIESFLKK